MTPVVLPDRFSDLAPFADWALAGADERQNHRRAASKAQIKAFYDAALPRTEAILAEIDKYPMGKLPEELKPLFYIALSLAEIAPHVELYGGVPDVPHAFEESRFVAAHGHADTAEEVARTVV